MRKEDIIVPGRVYAVEEMERLLAVREERRAAEQRAAELKAVRDSSIHHALRDLLREALVIPPFLAVARSGAKRSSPVDQTFAC